MRDSSSTHAGTDISIREASPREVEAWDELVGRFPGGRIFHKTVWLRYVESFSGARAVRLVFEREGEVVGCLPGFLLRKGFLLRVFASPLAGWQTESMGPVFDPARVAARELFAALLPFLKTRYGVHHVEMTCALSGGEAADGLGFRVRQFSTCRAPLFPGDEERALKNIKAKTRNQLRKAFKLGLVARVEEDEAFVAEFYDQVKEVFARRGKAVPFDEGRVLKCFRHLKEAGNLLAVSVSLPDDDRRIATGLFMCDGRELHLWGWAHRTAYGSYCPVELLTWTAMRRGMEAGCTTFDMGGGGDAKRKYGAQPDAALHQWMWSRYAGLARARDLAERAYRWQQSARGRFTRRRSAGESSKTHAPGGEAGHAAGSSARAADARLPHADEMTPNES